MYFYLEIKRQDHSTLRTKKQTKSYGNTLQLNLFSSLDEREKSLYCLKPGREIRFPKSLIEFNLVRVPRVIFVLEEEYKKAPKPAETSHKYNSNKNKYNSISSNIVKEIPFTHTQHAAVKIVLPAGIYRARKKIFALRFHISLDFRQSKFD